MWRYSPKSGRGGVVCGVQCRPLRLDMGKARGQVWASEKEQNCGGSCVNQVRLCCLGLDFSACV